jgi:UDP-glucuronate 4-epimerase
MKKNNHKILVTGSAGFIGYHLARKLLDNGYVVIGVDNFNDYYEVKLKEDRNKILANYSNFELVRGDLSDELFVNKLFNNNNIDCVYHLAAQAGVQYSKDNPQEYIKSNIKAFINILEGMRKQGILKLFFSSSSTVYGESNNVPFKPQNNTDKPISVYAATKKADELLAYTYHYLYGINVSIFRLFSVIGPYGRPDMIPSLFTNSILKGDTIKVFNYGKIKRAFTYVDDVVLAFFKAIDKCHGYNIYNVGREKSYKIDFFISTLENILGKKTKIQYSEAVSGDMSITDADIEKTKNDLNWQPETSLEEAIAKFVLWYKDYYKIIN